MNKSYYSKFTKLCKCIKNKEFTNKCLDNLDILPSKDPREDYNAQNETNKGLYQELLKNMFTELKRRNGEKMFKEKSKVFLPRTINTQKRDKKFSSKKIIKISKNNQTQGKRGSDSKRKIKSTIHQIDETIKNVSNEEINQLVNNVRSKWLNNPVFGGPVHYNNAIILDNKSQSFHGIILLDSGAGSNNIASNIVSQMDVEKHQFKANERPIVQAGETVAEVKEFCFLRIGVEFKYNQYYFILIKFNIIPVKKGDFHYDKIYVCDNKYKNIYSNIYNFN